MPRSNQKAGRKTYSLERLREAPKDAQAILAAVGLPLSVPSFEGAIREFIATDEIQELVVGARRLLLIGHSGTLGSPDSDGFVIDADSGEVLFALRSSDRPRLLFVASSLERFLRCLQIVDSVDYLLNHATDDELDNFIETKEVEKVADQISEVDRKAALRGGFFYSWLDGIRSQP